MGRDPLRFAAVGLGRGFMLMRPAFLGDPRCRLVAAADPRPEARAAFEAEFGGRAWPSVEALCAASDIDVVYVASPHGLHAAHAILAARSGKHVLVEKPMALTLADARAMDAAAREAGVQLIAGPSHSFDPPIAAAAALVAGGAFGPLRMITSVTYTDFVYRPRQPEELDSAQGGGVVFSQGAHQVDIVRRLAGAPLRSVRARVGVWDAGRPMEGAYQAWLNFEGGAAASLTYSGYGRYDTDALMGWIGETGSPVGPQDYGAARARLAGTDEASLKSARAYGAEAPAPTPPAGHEHFGFVLASCERADLRPTPAGVEIYDETERRTLPLDPPAYARRPVIDEVWAAVRGGKAPLHSGAWGAANLAACLAIIRSSTEDREIFLEEIEA